MTAPIEITIRITGWKDLPGNVVDALGEVVQFLKLGKVMEEAQAAAVAIEAADRKQEDAPHPGPLPLAGEREQEEVPEQVPEPPRPHAEIVEALMVEVDTVDVTRLLILPLLEKFPGIRGEPRHVLGKTAAQFKFYARRKLEFACSQLLEGKHEYFPDSGEIYAAIGKFDGYQARKRAEAQQQRELVSNGARL